MLVEDPLFLELVSDPESSSSRSSLFDKILLHYIVLLSKKRIRLL